jgi:hypothetical protein
MFCSHLDRDAVFHICNRQNEIRVSYGILQQMQRQAENVSTTATN